MPTPIAQKLRIKEGYTLRTINAPADFEKELGPLPTGVSLSPSADACQQIHWFVTTKAQMEKEMEKVMRLLKKDVLCWIYYPKGRSGLQTDLTRDKGWDALLKHQDLQWISLVSFNNIWSVFGMRYKTAADKAKETQPRKDRPILEYIDAVTKTVRLPNDFAALLQKHKAEKGFFDSLSFTNKKEYVEWVVSAKRPETRATRLAESITRLAKGWKNPANR